MKLWGIRIAACTGIIVGTLLGGQSAWSATGTRTASFEYDPTTGLLTKEIIEPGDTQLRLETVYGYDGFGNRLTATVSSPATGDAAIAPRTSTNAYDSQGRFATTATNALNHSETRVFDPRFGGLTSLTGPNGLTTQWQYDNFGRKTLETRADGTQTKWEYSYCSGVNGSTLTCATPTSKYMVAETPLDGLGNQNGPILYTYFDGLGRQVATQTQGFTGAAVLAYRQYDALGRVSQESRPYDGSSPLAWITYQYDVLGRVTLQTQPDNSTTQFTYAGLVRTSTNALGQTRTETRNSQDRIVSVKDALSGTTTFKYDPFSNPVQTTDAAGNVTTIQYDGRGRKTGMTEPNMGTWQYVPDALGQLVKQTDAKGQVTTVAYDLLGRVTGRAEVSGSSSWTWDTATKGIGKPASTTGSNGYQRQYAYDALGRSSQVTTTIAGTVFTTMVTYDDSSRIATITYPSGFAVRHVYTGLGFLSEVRNNASDALYWRADSMNAEMQLTGFTQGNGVSTTQTWSNLTGRLTGIQAGASGGVANFSYVWDPIGNLQQRTDANENLEEIFQYDALNRVTQAAITGGTTKSYQYDSIGNVIFKSDTGTYSYPTPGTARPNAVSSITGTLNTSFTYDANGNMTSGSGRTLTWTSFNKPETIARGGTTLSFDYDSEHRRIRQVAPGGTTLYINDAGSDLIFAERYVDTLGVTQWRNYVHAADGVVAVVYENSAGPGQTRYFHKDHLGSIAVITSETGAVLERLSYDTWGKRRHADGTDDPGGTLTSLTVRGFTGHEHLEPVALVHMNGRVYDPQTGRFMSADPFVGDALDTQALNRYSYVGNNPLAYTDPSGFFLKGLFKAVGKVFRSIWKPLVAVIVAAVMPYLIPTLATLGTLGSIIGGALSGLVSSAITSGFDLRSMLIGAIAGGLGAGLGGLADFAGQLGEQAGAWMDAAGNGALNAGTSMGMSSASTFWADAVGSFASNAADRLSTQFSNLVAKAVVGGTGGGHPNFVNGGATVGFEYVSGGGISQLSGSSRAIEWGKFGIMWGAAGGALYGAAVGGGIAVFTGGFGSPIVLPAVVGGTINGALIGGGLGFFMGTVADVYDHIVRSDDDSVDRLPPGSRPIDKTPWSGDHNQIKKALGLGGRDKIYVDPDGNLWVQNPDGSYTNYGPASNFTGSGKPSGRKGKDRDKN